ncbi:MAG: DNA adenine methylase [Oscillospiraceae bacterium]|jgi:adenine-specific DNA-methyltransferase|nr:DNA adenine methylase [Oscillospiraceae bacterium]
MRFIGCKNLLLNDIECLINRHAPKAESFCDIFSGTATVARYFKQKYTVISNDLLYFSYCLQRGTIENDSISSFSVLHNVLGISNPIEYFSNITVVEVETLLRDRRFFQNNFAPFGGRMYITDVNALRFDFARNTIEDWRAGSLLNDDEYFYLVACVVEGLPFVSNIRGTYGAFAKAWDKRAFKVYEPLRLEVTHNGKKNRCYNEDGVELLKRISGDILYIDPPYNARQYLPNYHVLETAARYDFPNLHGMTGLRDDSGQKSDFCSKAKVEFAFEQLLKNAQYKHIIFSYNTDGLMSVERIAEIMKTYGIPENYEMTEIPYRRFKSRSEIELGGLRELLFYIEKRV